MPRCHFPFSPREREREREREKEKENENETEKEKERARERARESERARERERERGERRGRWSDKKERERGADLRGPGGLRAEAASGASHHAATGATELVVFAYPKRRKNRHPCSLRGAGRIGKGSPLSGLGAGFVAQSAAEVRWPTPAST